MSLMDPVQDTLADRLQTLERSGLTSILFGHAAFQYLNAGCELGVFELLQERPGLAGAEIARSLELRDRPAKCLLLGLTSLGLVQKDGDDYRNGVAIETVYDADLWEEFVDIVRFEADIVYPPQREFVASLKADKNEGLRWIPGSGTDLYRRLSETPRLQDVFYRYMSSWSRISIPRLLQRVDLSDVRRAVDVGGGDATNAIALARAFPNLGVTLLDLPTNIAYARQKIRDARLEDRIEVLESDMFRDKFPADHDCFVFIHQLVIWPLDVVTMLLQRAHDALPSGGKVVIYNSMSNDEGDGPLMAALDSVYFVSAPAEGGMIYPWRDYEECLRTAGFRSIERIPCEEWTPHGIIVAVKD